MKSKAVTIMAIIAAILVAAAGTAQLLVPQEHSCTLEGQLDCHIATYGPDGNLDITITNNGAALEEVRVQLVAPHCEADANTRFFRNGLGAGQSQIVQFQCVERATPLKADLTVIFNEGDGRAVLSGKAIVP